MAAADPFGAAFGPRRGANDSFEDVCRRGDADDLLRSLPAMTETQALLVLRRIKELVATNTEANTDWLFAVPGRASQTSGERWSNWNDQLGSLLLEQLEKLRRRAQADPQSHSPLSYRYAHVLAQLEAHWDRFPACYDYALTSFPDDMPQEYALLLAVLPADGPLSLQAQRKLTRSLQTDDRVAWATAGELLGFPTVDRDSHVYRQVRERLLDRLPEQDGDAYRRLNVILRVQHRQAIEFDPVLLDAMAQHDFTGAVARLQVQRDVLAHTDGEYSRPAREAVMMELADLYAQPVAALQPDVLDERRQSRATFQQALLLEPNDDLRGRPAREQLVAALADSEADAYRRLLIQRTSMETVADDPDVRAAVKRLRKQVQQSMTDRLNGPTEPAGDLPRVSVTLGMLPALTDEFTQLSVNGGHRRFHAFTGFNDVTHKELESLPAKEWQVIWKKLFALTRMEINAQKTRPTTTTEMTFQLSATGIRAETVKALKRAAAAKQAV